MKTLLRALTLVLGLWPGTLFAQQTGPPQIGCDGFFQVSQAATGLTKVISGVAGQAISWCGWAFNSGAATSTAQLKYGTGANCGTNTVTLTPPISLAINGSYVDHIGIAHVSLPMATDLCLVTTGTGPAQVMIYYSIQ